MKEYKVPIQSLIDHIKTASDVDPWAKEMAEKLLKEQEETELCDRCGRRRLKSSKEAVKAEIEGGGSSWWYVCSECHGKIDKNDQYCRHCGGRITE